MDAKKSVFAIYLWKALTRVSTCFENEYAVAADHTIICSQQGLNPEKVRSYRHNL